MKLLTLKKSSLEKEEVNNPGRKTEEHEQVKEDKGAEADKLEEKGKIRKEDCIEGGGPLGVFPSKQKVPSSNILEGDPPKGKERAPPPKKKVP